MIPKKKGVYQLIEETQSFFQKLLITDEENSEYKFFVKRLGDIEHDLRNKNRLFVVSDNLPLLMEILEKQNLYFEKGKTSEEFNLFFDMTEIKVPRIKFKCCSESFFQEKAVDSDGAIFITHTEVQYRTAEGIAQEYIAWEDIEGTFFFSKLLKAFYLKVEYQKTEKVLEVLKTEIERQKKNFTDLKTLRLEDKEKTENALTSFKDEIEKWLDIKGKMFSLELSESIHSIPSDNSRRDFQDCIEEYCEMAYDLIDEVVEKYEKRLSNEMNQIKKKYLCILTQRNALKNTIEVDLEDDFLKLPLKNAKNTSFWTFLKSSFKQNLFLNLAMYGMIFLCCIMIFQLPFERKIPVIGFKYTIIGLGQPVTLFDNVDLSQVSAEIMENPVKLGNIGFTILVVSLLVMIISVVVLLLSNWALFKLEMKLQRRTLSDWMRQRWYGINKAAYFREQFAESYERATLQDLDEILRTNKERFKYLADNTLERVNETILFIKETEMEIKKIETEVYYE